MYDLNIRLVSQRIKSSMFLTSLEESRHERDGIIIEESMTDIYYNPEGVT